MKKWIIPIIILLISSPAFAANKWLDGTGDNPLKGATLINDIDTQVQNEIIEPLERYLIEGREGMRLKYDTAAKLTVTSGAIVCADSGDVLRIRRTTSDTTVTWADIDTGAEAASTTYYVYANCDADATTATFEISTNSSTPNGVTYYRRLGQFTNDSSSNITAVKNDDERVLVATGTVANGNPITVPSGWSADECSWTVGLGSGPSAAAGTSNPDGIYYTVTVDSSRVVSCYATSINGSGFCNSGTCTCTANYAISCFR